MRSFCAPSAARGRDDVASAAAVSHVAHRLDTRSDAFAFAPSSSPSVDRAAIARRVVVDVVARRPLAHRAACDGVNAADATEERVIL
jgi:hypothetical protein